MKMKLFLGLFLLFAAFSCASGYLTVGINEKVKKVQLGMNKADIIHEMGTLYIVDSNKTNAAGENEEVLVYKSYFDEEFRFTLINGILLNWERVHVKAVIVPENLEKK